MKKYQKDIPNHTISGQELSTSTEEPKIINSYLKPKTNNHLTRKVFIEKLGSIIVPAIFIPSLLSCEDELPDTYITEEELFLSPSHEGNTMDIISLDNASKILSIGSDETLKVWGNSNQSLLKTITFDKQVIGLCVDINEEIMMIIHHSNEVSIMTVKDFTITKTINIDITPVSYSLNSDGSTFAVANGSKIYIYKVNTGELVNTITSDLYDHVRKRVIFVGDSSKIACINYDDVSIFDIYSGELLASFPMQWKTVFTCLAISRDGKTLVCGNKKGFQAFNSESFELEIQYYPGGGSTTNSDNIEFSRDDKYIFVSKGTNILTIDRSTGDIINTAYTGTPYLKEYTCIGNNNIVAAINVSSAKSDYNLSFIGVWDSVSGSIINSYKDESIEVAFIQDEGVQYLDTSCRCDLVCQCNQVCDCLGVCTCDTACNSHDSCPSHSIPNCSCEFVGRCNCYSVCIINY